LCGAYVRVSTEEQAQVEEGSLKNQQERIEKFVELKNTSGGKSEWVLVKKYPEEGRSAKDLHRPKFQEMMRDIEGGIINMVLFTKLDRLSRSTRDFLEFSDRLRQKEVDFICLSSPDIDTTTAQGKVLFSLLTVLGEFERDIDVERAKDSYNSRAGRGLWTGGQIIGYDLPEKKKGYLTKNPEEEKVVKFIFRNYLEKKSIDQVVKACSEMGFRTKTYMSRRGRQRSGGRFTYTSVKQILQNPAYNGQKVIHKHNRRKSDKSDLSEDRYQVITTECWEPLVDDRTFEQTQRILKNNAKARSLDKNPIRPYPYLLSDLLVCEHCRTPLTHGGTRKGGRLIPHYVHRKGQRLKDCPLPANIHAEMLDTKVWERLAKEIPLSDEMIRKAAEEAAGEEPKIIEALRADIQVAQKAIRAKISEHERVVGGLSGLLDRLSREHLQRLSDETGALEVRIAEWTSELGRLEQRNTYGRGLARLLKDRPKAVGKLPDEKKISLARIVLSSIILRGAAIVLERRLGEPVVGDVREAMTKRGKITMSHRYRFFNVEWLN
jgi:site-specific DNA recombinase